MSYIGPDGQNYDDGGNPIPSPYNDFPGATGTAPVSSTPGGPAPGAPAAPVFVNTAPASKLPNGIPDPANPGYDTNGYTIGSSVGPDGKLIVPNAATGKTTTTDPKTLVTSTAPNATTTPSQPDYGSVLNSPLLAPWTVPFSYADFQGPTYTPATLNDLYTKDPGYQARLNAQQQTQERGAAAQGTLLNAGTVQAEGQAAQDYASNEWGNFNNQNIANFQTTYNSDLTDWTTNYNKAIQDYQQAYNIFSNNQANQFNRLASISGLGQTAASQLNSAGLGYAQLNNTTTTGTANTVGGLYGQAANANAAGTVGSANALNGFIGNLNNIGQLYASSYAKQNPSQ